MEKGVSQFIELDLAICLAVPGGIRAALGHGM